MAAARACCTCCASASACRAPRTPASRASAARARCSSTARCLRLPRAGGGGGRLRHPTVEGLGRRRACCQRRAAGVRRRRRRAVRLLHARASSSRSTTCSTTRPTRPTSRSARRSPATCAAAPATAGSSTPSTPRCVVRRRAAVVTGRRRRRPTPAAAGGRVPAALGDSPPRPDGTPKVRGEFAFASDLRRRGDALGPHAALAASPRPHPSPSTSPRRSPSPACSPCSRPRTSPGDHLRARAHADQPVFADDVVRYVGEPVAVVAADHPEIAAPGHRGDRRRPTSRCPVLSDGGPRRGRRPDPPDGNVVRHVPIRHGDPTAEGDVVVEGTYEVGMQDQAFLGPEAGLAVPDGDGGVDLCVATQWLHHDRDQVAACLGLPPRPRPPPPRRGRRGVRRPGGRQPPRARLPPRPPHRPARADDLPPRRVVPRARAPAPGGDAATATTPTATARSSRSRPRSLLDGGAYASSSPAVCSNAARFAAGPYKVPNAVVDAVVVRTNNPPCGAMRGFGAVQACFAHESQMDKLAGGPRHRPRRAPPAQRAGARRRRAHRAGDHRRHPRCGSASRPPWPTRCRPDEADGRAAGACPGGAGRTADRAPTCGAASAFAVGCKNLLFSEGFDDDSEAACRARRRRRHRHVRGGRGRPGLRHHRPADRPHDARRRRGGRRRGRDGEHRLGRLAPRPPARRGCPAAPSRRPASSSPTRCGPTSPRSLDVRRRLAASRRPTAGSVDLGGTVDVGVAEAAGDRRSRPPCGTSTARPYPLDDDGQGDCDVSLRLRGPPRRRRRRPRARPGAGRADRHRPGRRPGAATRCRSSGRSRAASPRAWGWP